MVAPTDFDEQHLAHLLRTLLVHVRWRAKKMFWWLGTGTDDLGLGKHCEDIAAFAVESMFEHPEKWARLTALERLDQLKAIANSEIVNLQQKLRRRTRRGEQFAHDGEFLNVVADLSESAEEVVAFREFCDAIESAILEKDPDGQLMMLYDMAFTDEDLSPSHVAETLKITVRQADGLKKKLRRLVNEVRVGLGMSNMQMTRGALR